MGQVGDFRRGSLNEVRRKCGKPNCACAAPGHPGHGPQWNLTRKAGGRTRTVHLRPGPELEKARREVAEYERFRDLAGQVTEVNEAICAGPPGRAGRAPARMPLPGREGKRGAPGRARAGEGRRARTARRRGGQGPGLRRCGPGGRRAGDPRRAAAAGRRACWASVLSADRGHRGPRVPCGNGHEALLRRLPGQVLRHRPRPGHRHAGLVSLRGVRARPRPARRRARRRRGVHVARAWPR